MKATGEGRLRVLIIAEAPGAQEDEQGLQLVGKAGQRLREVFARYGLDLDRDFWTIHAANCRPIGKNGKGNRKPTTRELRACWQVMVLPTIERLRPQQIWLLGASAVEQFYGTRLEKAGIAKLRGRHVPEFFSWANFTETTETTGRWVFCTYHPSAILRSGSEDAGGESHYQREDENLVAVWERDLDRAIRLIRRPPPQWEDPVKEVQIITDFDEAHAAMQRALLLDKSVVDFEANHKNPNIPGYRILSGAFSMEHRVVSMPIDHKHWTPEQRQIIKNDWRTFMAASSIKKIAHNLKYEHQATRCALLAQAGPWEHDTMVAAHVEDNTTGINGLKTQALLRFGIDDYSREVDQWMEIPKGAVFNRLEEYDLQKLLLYGGTDVAVTWRLYQYQIQGPLAPHQPRGEAYQFFHRGLVALAEMEAEGGIYTDQQYYAQQYRLLSVDIEAAHNAIMNDPATLRFAELEGHSLDLGSPLDMRLLLFGKRHLALTSSKKTETGLDSVDADVLEDIGVQHPFAKRIVRWRKKKKLRDTYLVQYMSEHPDAEGNTVKNWSCIDGYVHPEHQLHTVASYRSSVKNPNSQNNPKREAEAKKVVRGGIVAPPGYRVGEGDLSGAEVRTMACLSRDRALIHYVNDKTADMHRDESEGLYCLKRDQITKSIRNWTKNQWVFPQFYGSYAGSCAPALWEEFDSPELKLTDGRTLEEHINSFYDAWNNLYHDKRMARLRKRDKRLVGRRVFSIYDLWEEHCFAREAVFWQKFHGLREWQNTLNEQYRKVGYIESPLKFRYGGRMRRNEVYNYDNQGLAFHVLLWIFCEFQDEKKRRGWKTRAATEIHDSIFLYFWPPEVDDVADFIYATVARLPEVFPWIIVPIEIEIEIAPIGASWLAIEPYKKAA